MVQGGNIFTAGPNVLAAEQTLELYSAPNITIEKIVSTGQASPVGFWFDQGWTEWVILLSGSAGLLVEGEASIRTLRPGDFLELAAHVRHRVEWTAADQPTVWLAMHIKPPSTHGQP